MAIVLATFIGVPLTVGGSLGAVALHIAGAIDGYRCARAWPGSGRLPWYARWPSLASIMVFCILGVLILRAFIVEPFRIPSSAMIPTLVVGDYILVNKSAYGARLPSSGRRIVALGEPKRGDVAVFRYPEKPEIDYVKRVVALPGDRVAYINKQLSINGQAAPLTPAADYQYAESLRSYGSDQTVSRGLGWSPARNPHQPRTGTRATGHGKAVPAPRGL